MKKKAKGKGGKKVTWSKWFVSLTSSVEMDKICEGFVPKNTNWMVVVRLRFQLIAVFCPGITQLLVVVVCC